VDDDIITSTPDCPNCGTRSVPSKGGLFICRTCKIAVHPAADLQA